MFEVNQEDGTVPENSSKGKNVLDGALLELSKHIVTTSDVRTVGIQGLGMQSNTVDKHISDAQDKATSAAYSMLQEWLAGQKDLEMAWINIKRALAKIDKNLWIEIVSQYESHV